MSAGNVLTFGETMGLYSAQRIGEVHLGDPYRFSVGGTESNVAIGLARLGTAVAWVGRVGDDETGRVISRTLNGEGVETHVRVDATAASGVMTRARRLPGKSSVAYFRADSAGSRLNTDDIPLALINSALLVHVTGVTAAISRSAADTIDAVIATARASSVPVSFDVNYRARLWSREQAAPALKAIAEQSDVILAGEDEAELLTGQSTLNGQLAALQAFGATQVIVKRGADGAAALIDGRRYDAPGVSITPVDTVGAGDAFAAGYLHALVAGTGPQERLSLANRVAAFVCSAEGDWEGLPLAHELALLESAEPVTR
jgi:2-dehydro-3-deoxygluconokinase